MKIVTIFGLIFITELWQTSESQAVSDVKSVLTKLFTTDTYNKRIRPVNDQSQPVTVTIDFYLVGIDEFDEVTQKLTTTAYLSIIWTDEELQWDPATYGDVTKIQLPQNEIWKPDITLQNGKSDMKELGGSYLLVNIENDGTVFWTPYHNFQTKCAVDVSYFPFDEQTCELKFVAWSSFVEDIEIDHGNIGIILDEYEENGEWEILKTNSSHSKTNLEATVIYSLYLKRRPVFTILNIIVPIMLLGFVDLFVFILPADSGEKVGFSVTVLLAFAVFLTIVSDSLPKNSIKTPILSIYLIIQITVSTLCVLLTIFQLRIYHRDDSHPVSARTVKFVRLVRKLKCTGSHVNCCTCCNRNKVVELKKEETIRYKSGTGETPIKISLASDKEVGENSDQSLKVTWKSVAESMDYVLFWLLFFVQFAAITSFFLITKFKLKY